MSDFDFLTNPDHGKILMGLSPTEVEIVQQYRDIQGSIYPTAIIIWLRPKSPTTILIARPPQRRNGNAGGK